MDHDPFDIEADIGGAYLKVGDIVLTNRCKGMPEINFNIDQIKRKLEEAAKRMDAAWRERDARPDF